MNRTRAAPWRSHPAHRLPAVLLPAALLAGCANTPDCDADLALTALKAGLARVVAAKFDQRLRAPAITPGSLELNPRKLAEAARTEPVKIVIDGVQQISVEAGGLRQCAAQLSLSVALHDLPSPLQKSVAARYSIHAEGSGFRLDLLPDSLSTQLD
jgi:hypothetical protein